MRKFSTDAFSGRLYYRGVADSTIDNGGQIIRNAAFNGQLQSLQTVVVNNNWGWLGTTRVVGTPANITGMVQNADGTVTITVAGTPFTAYVNKNLSIRISGQIQPGNINGPLVIFVNSNNSGTSIKPIAIRPFIQSNGKVFAYASNFHPVSRLTVVNATQRKAGVPFGVSRGRSRNRVRA